MSMLVVFCFKLQHCSEHAVFSFKCQDCSEHVHTLGVQFQNAEHLVEAWPSKEECDTYVQKVPDPRNLSTGYLSPENKGFE